MITLDGATGEVFVGAVAMVEPAMSGDFGNPHGMGRRVPADARARQRGNASRRRNGAQVRRRGHRPLPHRAHVLRSRAHRCGPADDHGRATSTAAAPRWSGCCRSSGEDFVGAVPHHGGPAGDHPPARSAAARIPAPRRRRTGGDRRGARHRHGDDAPAPGRTGRGQPDARPSRLPPWHHLPRDLRDAGARDLRGRAGGCRTRPARRRSRKS